MTLCTRLAPFVWSLMLCGCNAARERAVDSELPHMSTGAHDENADTMTDRTELDGTLTPPDTRLDLPAGTSDGSLNDGCDPMVVTQSAQLVQRPADIVLVVDNSGTMFVENDEVQANLNRLSTQIVASGVDPRVILISNDNICVPPPLGSGTCPRDDNEPGFFHEHRYVSSNVPLQEILASKPNWEHLIRSNSVKHVVVVSDDNSIVAADDFHTWMHSQGSSYRDYRFHGVVALWMCAEAAAVGQVYIDLAERTGGVVSDLCEQNFQPVFDQLSEAVIEGSGLACQLELPADEAFDPEKVNLWFDNDGARETIGQVDSVEACAASGEGWYYDDPSVPAAITVCPTTCERFEASLEGSVEIQLGCPTVVVPG